MKIANEIQKNMFDQSNRWSKARRHTSLIRKIQTYLKAATNTGGKMPGGFPAYDGDLDFALDIAIYHLNKQEGKEMDRYFQIFVDNGIPILDPEEKQP